MRNASKKPFRLRFLGVLATLVLVAFSTAGNSAPKDYAVVIGVDEVSGISQKLKGASIDAQDFAEQLRHRGIEPVVLINGQATRAAVTSAISGGAKADNFIFYFAGLGSGPNTPRLMTSEDKKGMSLEDIDKALLKAGAGTTTVILDTSFSGLRAEKSGPSLFTSRYYEPPSRDVGIQSLGANAAELPGLNHQKICYITAGRFNEDAFEDTIDGKPHGVFTHYLVGRLNTDQAVAWQTIQWDVAAQVAAHVDDQQHPNFPVSFLANAAFEGSKVAPAEYGKGGPEIGAESHPNPPVTSQGVNPASRTLWTLFNVDNVDPRVVSLAMRPNLAEVGVQEPLEFDLTVGKAGYLVVVEHSVEGTLVPVFPRDGDISSAQVQAGQKVVIPEPGITAFADRPGKERLKALLFDDEEAARELLAGLLVPASAGDSAASFGSASKRLQSRGIRFARSAEFGSQPHKVNNIPVTADLTFRVVSK